MPAKKKAAKHDDDTGCSDFFVGGEIPTAFAGKLFLWSLVAVSQKLARASRKAPEPHKDSTRLNVQTHAFQTPLQKRSVQGCTILRPMHAMLLCLCSMIFLLHAHRFPCVIFVSVVLRVEPLEHLRVSSLVLLHELVHLPKVSRADMTTQQHKYRKQLVRKWLKTGDRIGRHRTIIKTTEMYHRMKAKRKRKRRSLV